MARPAKNPDEKRTRWDALYVTRAEREEILAEAGAVDMSVSRYLLGLRKGRAARPRGEGAARLMALRDIEARMAAILATLEGADPADRLPILARLLAVERQARAAALGRGQGGIDADPGEDAP